MQTADIATSTQCWCERIWAADFARSAPLRSNNFFQLPLTAPLPLMPFSAPLTLRSALTCSDDDDTDSVSPFRRRRFGCRRFDRRPWQVDLDLPYLLWWVFVCEIFKKKMTRITPNDDQRFVNVNYSCLKNSLRMGGIGLSIGELLLLPTLTTEQRRLSPPPPSSSFPIMHIPQSWVMSCMADVHEVQETTISPSSTDR